MGRDKALLPFGDRTLLEVQAGKCREMFAEVVLLSGTRKYPSGLRHVFDRIQDAGPLSGLLSALEDPQQASDDLVLLAVDLPEVQPETLHRLAVADIPDGYDAMIAGTGGVDGIAEIDGIDRIDRTDGEPRAGVGAEAEAGAGSGSGSGKRHPRQPLMGIYHRRIAPELRAYLDGGDRSVMGFLDKIRTTTFKVPDRELQNMNTEDDYRSLSG